VASTRRQTLAPAGFNVAQRGTRPCAGTRLYPECQYAAMLDAGATRVGFTVGWLRSGGCADQEQALDSGSMCCRFVAQYASQLVDSALRARPIQDVLRKKGKYE
jgi:hypothetical protein